MLVEEIAKVGTGRPGIVTVDHRSPAVVHPVVERGGRQHQALLGSCKWQKVEEIAKVGTARPGAITEDH